MKSFFSLLTIAIFCASCFGIGSSDKDGASAQKSDNTEQTSESSDNPFAAIREAKKEIEKLSAKDENGEKVEVYHFKDLQKLTPEKLAGYSRATKEGSTNSLMGIKLSATESDYTDGDSKIEISITDTGGAGMALMGMAAWSQLESESETEDGYERTTTWEGYKCFESYSKRNNRSSMALIVADRIIVNAEGNVEMDELKRFLKKMDLEDLG